MPDLVARSVAQSCFELDIQRFEFFRVLRLEWGVTTSTAKTVGELAERMRLAGRPSDDDVTILVDGRRIDSKEAVEQWLLEVDTLRASRAALSDSDK